MHDTVIWSNQANVLLALVLSDCFHRRKQNRVARNGEPAKVGFPRLKNVCGAASL